MATGIKLTLPITFTDATLPVLPAVDALESSGSLALYEPGHPANPLIGAPVNATPIPNLLAARALATITSATTATLAGAWTQTADYSGAQGKVERSVKGGVHCIPSQTTPGALTRSARLIAGTALLAYVIANYGHDFFLSQWRRHTRINLPGANVTKLRFNITPHWATFYNRADTTSGDTEYPADATRIGFRHAGTSPATLGPVIQNMGKRATAAPSSDELNLYNSGNVRNTAGLDGADVFYRFYLEDLTVSGRSYAQVDALDFAEYTKQVLTAGGRYYGDTFTAPSTIP